MILFDILIAGGYLIFGFCAYKIGKLKTQQKLLKGLRDLNNRTTALYSHLQEGHFLAVGEMIDLIK